MTGDLLKRLAEEGKREDAGKPDQWTKIGDIVPRVTKQLGIEKRLAIEAPNLKLVDLLAVEPTPGITDHISWMAEVEKVWNSDCDK